MFPSLDVWGEKFHLAGPVEETDSRLLFQEMSANIWLGTRTCGTKTYASDF
jgi:hypothetical protein